MMAIAQRHLWSSAVLKLLGKGLPMFESPFLERGFPLQLFVCPLALETMLNTYTNPAIAMIGAVPAEKQIE